MRLLIFLLTFPVSFISWFFLYCCIRLCALSWQNPFTFIIQNNIFGSLGRISVLLLWMCFLAAWLQGIIEGEW